MPGRGNKDENGAESFRFFRGKNGNGMGLGIWKRNRILQNGNKNGTFLAKTETKMKQRFPAERT
jgi:hypothetical protein